MNYQQKVEAFLSKKIIAVAGVSRNPKTEVGNAIYKKIKSAGYTVYPINPSADVVEGDKCYPNLKSTPQKAEAVLITTNPKNSLQVVRECAEAGINLVWFHRSFGDGSYTKEAEDFCKANGITAITAGCPMMHIKDADFFHKMAKFFFKLSGKLK